MNILITGSAGFIGYHLALRLLNNSKHKIFGIDNINSYYDVSLKKKRLNQLKKFSNFKFYKLDISDTLKIHNNFLKNKYDIVVNLAAQAGVRYSIENPEKYFDSNLKGFFNILESSRKEKIKHLIFASTSSVYGNTSKFPLKESFETDKPLSFYAATKKSNEVMAYSYSHIYKMPITGLRFFTVYGPFGRPDMSLYKFTESIINKENIKLFNNGNHVRDFTYIDDVVKSIELLINKPSKDKETPYRVLNISSNKPKSLKFFISTIEKKLGQKAKKTYKKLQLGDVKKTHGDNSIIRKITSYKKFMEFDKGIENFVNWYIKFKK